MCFSKHSPPGGDRQNYGNMSSLTDEEHNRLVRLQTLQREMELLQILGDHTGRLLDMERELYARTGSIDPVNSHHAMASEVRKQDLDEMMKLQQQIDNLEINKDDTKSVNKRSAEEEDLGGPSNKNTKYDSSSSSKS